ncbi:GSTD1-5 protein, putative [Pediculus humanus corporis]|uniref:GSTD1-5 protein, putative n=1 Tax=Pediculus humanus subsp. corporis TaxID=121224 RepID=E0VNB6_PEDHC|nr:GSTD1-5 protein, putative [Pediculus humanus corporis]EEB14872.1 GSTD1-5 protein, putative [Pediculus humanus corporis]
MVLKLYSVSDGPPSLAVRMALKYLGKEYELINVDFLSGFHTTENYANMNPQKEIPVLDDDEYGMHSFTPFICFSSNAILQYLADRYPKDDTLYPQDPKKRALVNHRLAFNLSTYYSNIGQHVMLPIFYKYKRTPLTLKKVNMALDVFNTYLKKLNKKYSADAINFDFSPYTKVYNPRDQMLINVWVVEWYSRFKKEYPELWEIAEKGMKEIENFNKNPPDLSHLNHPIHHFQNS